MYPVTRGHRTAIGANSQVPASNGVTNRTMQGVRRIPDTMKTLSTRHTLVTQSPAFRAVLGLMSVLGIGASAHAVEKTWDGGAGTANWHDAANWSPDGVPAAADDVSEDIECVVEEGRMVLVSPERILWIEACQNYTMLRLVDGGPTLMLARTMSEWERLLSRQGFERLSRSMIINLRRIQTVCWESRDATVVDFLGCTHQLRLGRTAALRLKARLKNSLSQ